MPASYASVLAALHLFPLHAPITLFLLPAPHGKHSSPSVFNLPGKFAWSTMELVSPLIMLSTSLAKASSGPASSLPGPTLLLVAAFLAHYANRSIVSVLRSSAMADMNLLAYLSAVAFNLAFVP